jgi:hypothetical protein
MTGPEFLFCLSRNWTLPSRELAAILSRRRTHDPDPAADGAGKPTAYLAAGRPVGAVQEPEPVGLIHQRLRSIPRASACSHALRHASA